MAGLGVTEGRRLVFSASSAGGTVPSGSGISPSSDSNPGSSTPSSSASSGAAAVLIVGPGGGALAGAVASGGSCRTSGAGLGARAYPGGLCLTRVPPVVGEKKRLSGPEDCVAGASGCAASGESCIVEVGKAEVAAKVAVDGKVDVSAVTVAVSFGTGPPSVEGNGPGSSVGEKAPVPVDGASS